jgi:signal transduction histidine kinase
VKYPSPVLGSLLLAVAPLLTVAAHLGRRRARGTVELRTAHAALERRHAALQTEVDRLTRQAADVDRERDEFLATLSHELRSPLNAMLGWIELLRLHIKDPAQQAHAIDVLERNARAEVRIVSDLLDAARLVTRRLHLVREPLALDDIVQQAVDVVTDAATAKGIIVQVRATPGVRVVGDRTRLGQVVVHLLNNAIKFSDRGAAVTISIHQEPGAALIRVSDTGIGIARDILPLVFDRFRQAERGLTRRYGGLGLGLTLARRLVELHGGTVEAASEGPGTGATFSVRLPTRAGA